MAALGYEKYIAQGGDWWARARGLGVGASRRAAAVGRGPGAWEWVHRAGRRLVGAGPGPGSGCIAQGGDWWARVQGLRGGKEMGSECGMDGRSFAPRAPSMMRCLLHLCPPPGVPSSAEPWLCEWRVGQGESSTGHAVCLRGALRSALCPVASRPRSGIVCVLCLIHVDGAPCCARVFSHNTHNGANVRGRPISTCGSMPRLTCLAPRSTAPCRASHAWRLVKPRHAPPHFAVAQSGRRLTGTTAPTWRRSTLTCVWQCRASPDPGSCCRSPTR
jgi:hypothetical protein